MAIISKNKKEKDLSKFITKMNKARKEGAKSFTYNGKTYVAKKTKSGMMVYKQK